MMCGMRAPKYIRAVKITNDTDSEVSIKAYFNSGETITFQLSASQVINVEREVNHGSYSTCDPVTKIEANGNSGLLKTLDFEPMGVEIHEYVFSTSNDGFTFDRVN